MIEYGGYYFKREPDMPIFGVPSSFKKDGVQYDVLVSLEGITEELAKEIHPSLTETTHVMSKERYPRAICTEETFATHKEALIRCMEFSYNLFPETTVVLKKKEVPVMYAMENVYNAIANKRLMCSTEKQLQGDIEKVLKGAGIANDRERRLDARNIIDFLCAHGIGVEIKIGGQRKEMLKQCERYAKFIQVRAIILVTNRSTGWPTEIEGKPTCVLNLGKAWL